MPAVATPRSPRTKPMPRDPAFDATLGLWRDPYGYLSDRCRRLATDVFEMRLGLVPTIGLSGGEAAELFYDTDRVQRPGALPKWIANVLFGKGGVQGLEGEAHRHRKQMYLEATAPERVAQLAAIVERVHGERLDRWKRADRLVLYEELRSLYCEAVCEWAGVPLPAEDVDRRAREMSLMFERAASFGPSRFRALRVRRRLDRWLAGIVEDTRNGRHHPPEGSALAIFAAHRDLEGRRLPAETVAVEVQNVLRPTIAVSIFSVFGALALHRHPEYRDRLGDSADREWFALEVRRFFPFFPMIAALVRRDFEWRGYSFPAGRRLLLDVYGTNHDPRAWGDPEAFRPERFRDRPIGPFEYIPQGGGDTAENHRCPGERIALELLKSTVPFLADRIEYDVPEQNLEIDRGRTPAMPKSRFVIVNVRPA